jgi:hypothetical protein
MLSDTMFFFWDASQTPIENNKKLKKDGFIVVIFDVNKMNPWCIECLQSYYNLPEVNSLDINTLFS